MNGHDRCWPRYLWRGSCTIIVGTCLFWLAGLALFTADALTLGRLLGPAPPAHCSGIAALTGGQDRITAALALLRMGYGRRLLISGVGPRATLTQLAGPQALPVASQIALGRHAISTIGNAMEVADWARAERLDCVTVVTAGYHIRRALLDLGRAAPEIRFFGHAVRPPALRHPWSIGTLTLLSREYLKLLGAWFGLTRGHAMA